MFIVFLFWLPYFHLLGELVSYQRMSGALQPFVETVDRDTALNALIRQIQCQRLWSLGFDGGSYYGDTVTPILLLTPAWRLLGPPEATNGALMFGVSAAMVFAVVQRLVLARFRDLRNGMHIRAFVHRMRHNHRSLEDLPA